MSIKQNGGVFGRNPTFNDVTIEGQLTFDGDIDVNSDLKVDGNLDVTGNINTGTYLSVTAGSPNIRFMESDTTDENYRVRGQAGQLIFEKITDAASVVAESFRIDASNDIKISSGNLIIGTSGKGIDFSATAHLPGMTSELLNDYEEGTFTPNLEDDAGNNYTGTYGYQEGSYTKIGNSVRFTLRIYADQSLTGNGLTGSEVLRIKDLPFIHANDNIGTGIAINNGGNFNYDAGYTQALSVVASNKSYIIFRQLGDSVTANNLTVTKCDSIGGITGFYAFVSGVYVV